MAGHSQFKNIMYRKGAQDAKRAKAFTKVIREINAAVRGGLPDANSNPRLRAAMQLARASNMSKDTIERAIKRATDGGQGENYEEVRYEGFGPGGVGIIVEALTDNRNRTASDVRAIFSKNGGSLGENGSVSFGFQRVGLLRFALAVASADQMFEAVVEAGGEDVDSSGEVHEVRCQPDDLGTVREALEARFGTPEQARLAWRPQSTVPVDAEAAERLFHMLELLEDNDDVQFVTANFEVDDAVLERMSA